MEANFDIYASAAGGNLPFVVTVSTVVRDGAVTIDFVRDKNNPQINGIEVLLGAAPVAPPVKAPVRNPTRAPVPVTLPTQTPVLVHRINCGSTNQIVVPPNNLVWTPDQYSTLGALYNTCGGNTSSIYCTSRYFRATDAPPHRYNLPVSATIRSYTVRLHFAEQVRVWRSGCYRQTCYSALMSSRFSLFLIPFRCYF